MFSEDNIIEKFYHAFENLDAERMLEWYHDDVTFEDPVFGVLRGEEAKNMWRMLCQTQQGKDFKIETSNIEYTPEAGKARWEAYYTFSKTGKKVHNIINATFKFKDGKIINHVDKFSLYRWSRQAFGAKGFLVGWTVFFRNKMNKTARLLLSDFQKKNSK
ncbi:nuclear transport factor 2 family protein [Aequorivita echinoideorum]|uniref:Nuclear transport factor 2 family protein n=1 Tax=Aequorivita echinoideorum TaxID=1549647 RepID=A0ABS5S5M3_9FLAO|nr:nuclear transport factor 2 family protein [Aequorivita echinoideorum]